MLSPTRIIRYIEKKLGYKFSELELDSEEILENIIEETLPLFSKYYPYSVKTKIHPFEDLVEDENNVYYLNSDTEIINVKNLIGSNNGSYDTCHIHPTAANRFTDPISSQLNADLMSIVRNPTTHRFIYPNKVEIFPQSSSVDSFIVTLNCVHPNHFGTIPVNMEEYFLKLALYDTQEALYQIRHRFANIQSTYGNIELFIDDLQSATDKKEELIEKLMNSSIKSPGRKKLYIF